MTGKKAFWLVLLALLLCVACATATGKQNAGVYTPVSAVADGKTEAAGDVLLDDVAITLNANGRGTIALDTVQRALTWSLDGAAFSAALGDEALNGTLENGVLTLNNFLETGMDVTFVCEAIGGSAVDGVHAALIAAKTTPAPTPEPTPEPPKFDAARWAGKWYGWFIVRSGSGKYAEAAGAYAVGLAYDQVVELTIEGDTGVFLAYNYDASPETPTAHVNVRFTEGGTPTGSMISMDGYCAALPIAAGDWTVEPSTRFENMLEITATYTDADGDAFTYSFYLRPWGARWDDVLPAEDLPYTDMLPPHYADWYLPQLNN